ncbi:MAG: XdhC family protein [Pseudomonadota bacterium]
MSASSPIHSVGEHPEDQLRFLVDKTDAGVRCALVTIVGIVDTASRNLGTHMVVAEDGDYAGTVSSGCIDGSVADFALQAIASGDRRRVQLGAGSNFIDLQLPCGGGVDLLIVPGPDTAAIRDVLAALDARRTCALLITPEALECVQDAETSPAADSFVVSYRPKLRLILAGRGAELTVFCRLATSCGFDVAAYSPDEVDVESCRSFGAKSHHLANTTVRPMLDADCWTAVVTLFHDHDWEPGVLLAALDSDAFYIGALGSRKTHANRLATLQRLGVDAATLDRLTGPIGLVPSMRNATMLSISTLAEIIDRMTSAPP